MPQDDPGGRTTGRTATTGGASRPSAVAKTQTTVNSNQARKNATTSLSKESGTPSSPGYIPPDEAAKIVNFTGAISTHGIIGPVVFNDNPNPLQAPFVTPGQRASRAANNYLNGTITASEETAQALPRQTNWGFRFHYNPESITESVQTSYTQTPSADDVGTLLGTGLGTISFQFLLNRMEDVAARKTLQTPMLGKQNFYDLGTLYDIEFLYRTVNGDPQQTTIVTKDARTPKADPGGTANLGFLYMTAIEIRFNNIRFKGFVTSLDFEHKMFSDKMVPLLTYVTVSATRYLSGSGLPGDPNAAVDDGDHPVKGPKAKPHTVTVGKGGFSPGIKVPVPRVPHIDLSPRYGP